MSFLRCRAYIVAFILILMENPVNNVDPDKTPYNVASDLGLHCFAYDLFMGFQVRMG